MNEKSIYDPTIHHRRSIRLKGYDYAQAGLYFITVCVQNNACLFGKIQNGAIILNDAGKMVERWYAELENKYPDKRCHEMVVMPNHFHCIIENIWDGCDMRMDARGAEMDDNTLLDAHNTQWGAHVGAPLRGRPTTPPATDDRGRPTTPPNIVERVHPATDERGRPTTSPATDEHGRPITHPAADDRGRPTTPPDIVEPGSPINNENNNAIAGQHAIYGYENKKYHATIGKVMDWFKTMTTNEYIRGVKNFGWPPFDKKLWQRNYYEHIIRDEQSYQRISEYIINNPAKWSEDKFYNK